MEAIRFRALNASAINFAMPEMQMGVRMDEVLGGEPGEKRMRMVYYRAPRAIEYEADGGVRFTVIAPEAKSVEVAGRAGTTWGTERHALTRGEDGTWSAVIRGIPAGFQYMSYFIDGVETLYPRAPIGYGYGFAVNFVDIPAPDGDFYAVKDVPHGAVRQEFYPSTLTGKLRSCWVYTPPAYDTTPEKKYPVWYVQHGGGENETGWFWQGKLNFILDNLIAEGKCEEMIVVANAGYAFTPERDEEVFLPGDLGQLLRQDCIPFIEQRFRVLADKDHRALSGLSMGAYQTQWEVYNHPEVYSYAGVFSGNCVDSRGRDVREYDTFRFLTPENAGNLNRNLKLLFFGRGLQEGGEKLPGEVEELHRRGIHAEYFVCEGVHEWQVWRKTAHCFAQKLFKD